jgi:hypothetical protein
LIDDQRGQALGVDAITRAAAPVRQKMPAAISAHCRAISNFVAGLVVGGECMGSPFPLDKEKARERLLRA